MTESASKRSAMPIAAGRPVRRARSELSRRDPETSQPDDFRSSRAGHDETTALGEGNPRGAPQISAV
jgi:hypothetical protein